MKSVRSRSFSATLVTLVMTAGLVGGAAGAASAAYDPNNPPYPVDPNNAASLTIYDATTGAVVTSGSNDTALNSLYFSANADFNPGKSKATLTGFLAETGKAPGAWSGQSLSAATTYPVVTAPAPVNGKTAPVAKGGASSSMGLLATNYPNTATSASDFYRLYQLRVNTTFPTPASQTYAFVDIQINTTAGTWQQVNPAPSSDTAPGAPTGVAATAGDASADVSWTAPSSNGGSAITKYTVTATPTSGSPVTKDVTTGTSTTMTGLTNGTQYGVTVTATNAVGTGPASSPAVNVTPTAVTTAPGAPTGVAATAGDASADVSWTAPASNGGSAITKYTVTATPTSGPPVTKDVTTGTSTTMTGLTNGTQYGVTVTATNAVGTGPASSPAVNVTPAAPTAPDAPTGVAATPADASADVSWSAPASNGGSAITKYTVTATPTLGLPVTKDVTTGSSTTMTGLTNGTQYAIAVTATNTVGTGPASSPAVNVTPTAPTAPDAPTAPTATAGNGSATVSFTAPAANGSPITSYTATSTPDGVTATGGASPLNVTGLTNGTSYTFTVTATNGVGTSPASPDSNAVIPSAPSKTDTSATLDQPARGVISGHPITLNGNVSGVAGATNVTLRTHVDHGATVDRVYSAPGGSYSLTFAPLHNATYRLLYLGDSTHNASASNVTRTVVHSAVSFGSIRVDGSRVTVTGRVAPALAGQLVAFGEYHGSTFVTLVRSRVGAGGRFTLAATLRRGQHFLRVKASATTQNAEGATVIRSVRTS